MPCYTPFSSGQEGYPSLISTNDERCNLDLWRQDLPSSAASLLKDRRPFSQRSVDRNIPGIHTPRKGLYSRDDCNYTGNWAVARILQSVVPTSDLYLRNLSAHPSPPYFFPGASACTGRKA